MPIGNRAVLEIVVQQLADCGITDITFCVGYLSHLIRAIFDSHPDRNVNISYIQEDIPLGTAAPVRLIEGLDDSFVLMNGDVLTTLDYRDLLRRHRETGNVLTVATVQRTMKLDYGVVRVEKAVGRVHAWEEKPEIVSLVSMGIYAVEPRAIDFIPEGVYFDFPDLVQALLAAEQPVGAYLYDGLWFDIGRRDDYEEAVTTWLQATMERNGNGNGNGNGYVNGNGAVHEMATELVRGSRTSAGTADLEER
jgi:NDP-sugar pyrophosphorylase family protein